MQIVTKIGNTGTKVVVDFTLYDKDEINWDELTVKLYDHPEVDITDLIGDEWSTEIEEAIYENLDQMMQEALDDAKIEEYISDQLFMEQI